MALNLKLINTFAAKVKVKVKVVKKFQASLSTANSFKQMLFMLETFLDL